MYKWWAGDKASIEQFADRVLRFHSKKLPHDWSPEFEAICRDAVLNTAHELQLIAANKNSTKLQGRCSALFHRPFAQRAAVLVARYHKKRFGGAITPNQLYKAVGQVAWVHATDEKITKVKIAKTDGSYRTAWKFGIVRTAQQYLMRWFLEATMDVPKLDYSVPGCGGIHGAANAILDGLEDEYRFWVTTDIKSAYPSITKGHLRPHVSVGERFERYVLFPSLSHYTHNYAETPANEPACCELPQGAAHSPFVLSAVIDGCLRDLSLNKTRVVVYADNIALGAHTPQKAKCAYFAVKKAFANLPRGLNLHSSKICDGFMTPSGIPSLDKDGFEQFNSIDFCGYRLSLDSVTSERRIRPSGKAWKKFWDSVQESIIPGEASIDTKSNQIDEKFARWKSGFKLWQPNNIALDHYQTQKEFQLQGWTDAPLVT